jgi:hypothetical protein
VKHLIDWTAIFAVFIFALHGSVWAALAATLIAAAWNCLAHWQGMNWRASGASSGGNGNA